MSSYQVDKFFVKHHTKAKSKFVVLINVETRKLMFINF